jgi:hypothetical protein
MCSPVGIYPDLAVQKGIESDRYWLTNAVLKEKEFYLSAPPIGGAISQPNLFQ